MASEMIERLARVLCAANSPRLHETQVPADVPADAAKQIFARAQQVWIDQNWRDYVPQVRAVLQELRDNPSEAMANAGTRVLALDWELSCDGRIAPEVFTAMLDRALEE